MRFERYYQPHALDECFALMSKYQNDCRLLAGGTDLIVRLRSGAYHTRAVIDITHIPELQGIRREEAGLVLGSAMRLCEVQHCEALKPQPFSVLSCCAGHISSMAVRNVATLGGNSCNASPCADTAPGLLLLDAVALIASAKEQRRVPVKDFYLEPGKTVMQQGEVLTGFYLPIAAPRTGAHYCKYSIRGDSDISIIGAGALLTLDDSNNITQARIALSSVAPTPLRIPKAEAMLIGKPCSKALFEHAAQLCAQNCSPITDHRASADYRREMVAFWTKQALSSAQAGATQ